MEMTPEEIEAIFDKPITSTKKKYPNPFNKGDRIGKAKGKALTPGKSIITIEDLKSLPIEIINNKKYFKSDGRQLMYCPNGYKVIKLILKKKLYYSFEKLSSMNP